MMSCDVVIMRQQESVTFAAECSIATSHMVVEVRGCLGVIADGFGDLANKLSAFWSSTQTDIAWPSGSVIKAWTGVDGAVLESVDLTAAGNDD